MAFGGGYNATVGKYVIQVNGNYVFTFSVVVIEGTVRITLKDDNGDIVEQIGKSVDQSIEVVTGTVVISRHPGTGVYLHVQRIGTTGRIMVDRCWLAGWLLNVYDQD